MNGMIIKKEHFALGKRTLHSKDVRNDHVSAQQEFFEEPVEVSDSTDQTASSQNLMEQYDAALEEKTQAFKRQMDTEKNILEKAFNRMLLEKTEDLQATLSAVLSELAKEREHLAKQYEAVAVVVAFECLVKLIGDAAAYKDILSKMVTKSYSDHKQRNPLSLKISRQDEQTVKALLLDETHEVEIVVDKTLAPGACVLFSDMEVVDASLQTQLDALKQVLVELQG